MAGLLENPPSRGDASIHPAVPESAVPRVMDGAVYLPVGKTVEPDSPEFEVLLRKNLPPEMAPDVLTNWRGVSARTSRIQWFCAVLFLLASAAFLYFLFPPVVHEDLVPHDGLTIRNLSEDFSFASPYYSLYREASACYDRGDYHRLCRILQPAVEKIVRTRDRGAYALAFLYFKTLRLLHKNGSGSRLAAGLLGELMEQDPDNPNWAQFYLELSPRIRTMLHYELVFQNLQRHSDWRTMTRLHLHNVDLALKHLDKLRKITNTGKFSAAELKRYQEDYDLFEVKLLLSRWLLLGTAAGLPLLPDNEYDPGVPEREKALRIALKHENARCEDFWLARIFIAKTLLSQDSLFNQIFWMGQYHSARNALEQEIKNCEQRLNRRKQS